MGDAAALRGEISAPATVGYVPQQAWIQNANVRDNILFGKTFDAVRYAATVEACALAADFEKFNDGDKTEIGERGVNINRFYLKRFLSLDPVAVLLTRRRQVSVG